MGLNVQIEAAWKEYCEKHYEKCHTGPLSIGSFAAGYRAAMRSLYVEVEPEALGDFQPCWVSLEGVLTKTEYIRSDRWQGGGFFFFKDHVNDSLPAADVSFAVIQATLPTPSDIFGEEG